MQRAFIPVSEEEFQSFDKTGPFTVADRHLARIGYYPGCFGKKYTAAQTQELHLK